MVVKLKECFTSNFVNTTSSLMKIIEIDETIDIDSGVDELDQDVLVDYIDQKGGRDFELLLEPWIGGRR